VHNYDVHISVRDLKRLIREGSINAPFDRMLVDDPAFNEQSVYVNDHVKDVIRDWVVSMFAIDRGDTRSMPSKHDS